VADCAECRGDLQRRKALELALGVKEPPKEEKPNAPRPIQDSQGKVDHDDFGWIGKVLIAAVAVGGVLYAISTGGAPGPGGRVNPEEMVAGLLLLGVGTVVAGVVWLFKRLFGSGDDKKP